MLNDFDNTSLNFAYTDNRIFIPQKNGMILVDENFNILNKIQFNGKLLLFNECLLYKNNLDVGYFRYTESDINLLNKTFKISKNYDSLNITSIENMVYSDGFILFHVKQKSGNNIIVTNEFSFILNIKNDEKLSLYEVNIYTINNKNEIRNIIYEQNEPNGIHNIGQFYYQLDENYFFKSYYKDKNDDIYYRDYTTDNYDLNKLN